MSTPPRAGRALRAAALLMALLMTTACAVRTTSILRDPSTVRIALYGWVGYEASAAVLQYLLKEEMGYQAQLVQLDEQPSWQALDQGALDVIVENWGHEDLMEIYGPNGNGTVVDGGPNGNIGVIGWYMPAYLLEEYPDLNTVDGIREHADLFRTPESGDQGEFLSGAPGFVTQDQGMINHFGLDLRIVYAGSEAAQITEVRNRYARREPVLFYFYEPQWLFNELDLVRVDFPDHTPGCDADLADIGCDYPRYELNKIYRTGFAEEGGPAFELIDAWKWSNDDQNAVAQLIADEGLDRDEAAARWARANPDTWKPWIPSQERAAPR